MVSILHSSLPIIGNVRKSITQAANEMDRETYGRNGTIYAIIYVDNIVDILGKTMELVYHNTLIKISLYFLTFIVINSKFNYSRCVKFRKNMQYHLNWRKIAAGFFR